MKLAQKSLLRIEKMLKFDKERVSQPLLSLLKSDIYSVKEVLKNNGKILIRLSNNKLVPYEDVFIVNKDEESKTITMNYPIDI